MQGEVILISDTFIKLLGRVAAISLVLVGSGGNAFEFNKPFAVPEESIPKLGSAYVVDKAELKRSVCVEWSDPQPQRQSLIKVRDEYKFHETQRSADEQLASMASLDVRSSWSLLGVGVKTSSRASYKNASRSNTSSKSVYISALAWGSSNYVTHRSAPKLTEAAVNALKQGRFWDLCGSGYVDTIYFGGYYRGLFTLTAQSSEQRREINKQLGVDVNAGNTDVKAQLSQARIAKLKAAGVQISAEGLNVGIPRISATTDEMQILQNLKEAANELSDPNYGGTNPVQIVVQSYSDLLAEVESGEEEASVRTVITFRNDLSRLIYDAYSVLDAVTVLQDVRSNKWDGLAAAKAMAAELVGPIEVLRQQGLACTMAAPDKCSMPILDVPKFSLDGSVQKQPIGTINELAAWIASLEDNLDSIRRQRCRFYGLDKVEKALPCDNQLTALRVVAYTSNHREANTPDVVKLTVDGRPWELKGGKAVDATDYFVAGMSELAELELTGASIEDLERARVEIMIEPHRDGSVDGWCVNSFEIHFQTERSAEWFGVKTLTDGRKGTCVWLDESLGKLRWEFRDWEIQNQRTPR